MTPQFRYESPIPSVIDASNVGQEVLLVKVYEDGYRLIGRKVEEIVDLFESKAAAEAYLRRLDPRGQLRERRNLPPLSMRGLVDSDYEVERAVMNGTLLLLDRYRLFNA